MKNYLLLAVLSFSISGNAQILPHSHSNNHKTSISHIEDKLKEINYKLSDDFDGKRFLGIVKPHSRELFPPVQIIDSIYGWQLDTLNFNWDVDYKISDIIYGPGNLPISYVQRTWNGAEWEYDEKYVLTFDANGNEIIELEQTWDGENWIDYTKDTYTYDAENNLISEVYQEWDDTLWTNDNRFSSTYDANNNQLSELNEHWEGDQWVNEDLVTFAYDANGNLISELYQFWVTDSWMTSYQTLNTYDINNNLISGRLQEFDEGVWIDTYQYFYTYDSANNQVGVLAKELNGSDWVNANQSNYYYDSNNFRTSETERYFDPSGTLIIYGDSIHYYFHLATGIHDLVSGTDQINVYPNPGHGIIHINTPEIVNSVEVYNRIGQRIYKKENSNGIGIQTIELSTPAAGIYFMQIQCGNKTYCRKINIQ